MIPYLGYGFLNGGSASSYLDPHKNSSEYGELFDLYRPYFDKMAPYKTQPKGITPAYINPNGSLGFHFMALKLRAILIEDLKYMIWKDIPRGEGKGLISLFQMDSILNHATIATAVEDYAKSEWIRPLAEYVGVDVAKIATASQKLSPTFTNKSHQEMEVFFKENGELLPMPGGHGQVYQVLKTILHDLRKQGKKFVYISNIDNLGALVAKATVAYMALTGKQGAFDFSFKTESDVKGGIAVEVDDKGLIDCGDLGSAISKETLREIEKNNLECPAEQKREILFNNATGLFNLDWLDENIDRIIESLPLRISVQKKVMGTYKQVEQVMWEVLGLMDNKSIIAVNKYERFLAAKMFVETLMNSRIQVESPKYPENLRELALKMNEGLSTLLGGRYGLKLQDGAWIPKSLDELINEVRGSFGR
ncbi:MAG: UTP--glucose-1-phosphate uridylyltransferase [Candidatus Margulisiibacteriota bacterium]